MHKLPTKTTRVRNLIVVYTVVAMKAALYHVFSFLTTNINGSESGLCLQIWRAAVNVLNKQLQTVEKG